MTYIYGLYDKNGHLRYIGKANDPDARLKRHMLDARRRKTPLYDWIRKHGKPEMRIIEADCQDWRLSERILIAQARKRGDNLLNVADGGDEPHCDDRTRKDNGHRLADRLSGDPFLQRVSYLKRELNKALGKGFVSNKTREKMRLCAKKAPSLFGEWTAIPNREECHV